MSSNVPKCPEMSWYVLKCPTHVQGLTWYHVSCENLLRHQQQNGSCFSTALAVARHDDACKVHMKKCVVLCRVNVVQCRPDVVLMSWWKTDIMYHAKNTTGKSWTHPSNASCDCYGYGSPIPKIVAACRQKSQDAQVKAWYNVRCKAGQKLSSPRREIVVQCRPCAVLTPAPFYAIMYDVKEG